MVQESDPMSSRRRFDEIKEEAVAAALAGEWQAAVKLNREAIQAAPRDAASHNRLATAYTELGNYFQARESAERALKLMPGNRIAQKHIERLAQLDGKLTAPSGLNNRAAVRFITDAAKATVSELSNPADPGVLATVSPGQALLAEDNGTRIFITTRAGERIGTLEVHIAQRLRTLIDAGNEYEFSVAKLSGNAVAVLVAETRCASGMSNVVSFPPSLQRSASDFDLDDEMIDEGDEDDGSVLSSEEDEEEIRPEAERAERIRSIVSGGLGGAYGFEDEALSI